MGRAKLECSAGIFVTSIQNIKKVKSDDIEVKRGQQLKALYRVSDRIFVESLSLDQGFVPYSSCRLSRKYYGTHSKLVQLSYVQLLSQPPDGVDILPSEFVPTISMIAVKNHVPSSHDEIQAQCGELFTALYCDESWIYVTNGKCSGFLPHSLCALSKDSQIIFQNWQLDGQPFQSDFVLNFNASHVDRNPLANAKKYSNKVGKIFTVVQNFVPDSPKNSSFTIRRGLRVKVIEENDHSLCVRVRTKTGVSFWIPSSHVRPARKYTF